LTLRGGGKIVIVNDMETPMDPYAVMKFSELGTVFEEIKTFFSDWEAGVRIKERP
jgi:NAD-dependent deacetylase